MNDAAYEALFALVHCHARASREVDSAPVGGLSLTELWLLQTMAQAPSGSRPTELARRLHLTPSGVTRALLPLEKRGIVVRKRDDADGRASLASLTPGGCELLELAQSGAGQIAERLLRRLSLGQTRQLIRLLEEIA